MTHLGSQYKVNRKNPTGLATCDRCGFEVNGGKLRKEMTYAGAPMPDESVSDRFMLSGSMMASGELRWNGFMICPKCVDVPNPQSRFNMPKADPYIALGNRPMRSVESYYTELPGELLLEDGGEILLETGDGIELES